MTRHHRTFCAPNSYRTPVTTEKLAVPLGDRGSVPAQVVAVACPGPVGARPAPATIPYTLVDGCWDDGSVVFALALDVKRRWLTIDGDLDFAASPHLEAAIALLVGASSGNCTVDVGGLQFIDAGGIGALVRFANELAGKSATLTVLGATDRVRSIFALAQLGAMLEPHDHQKHRSVDEVVCDIVE